MNSSIKLMKPMMNVDFKSKTVLTDSAWEYVDLWLARGKLTGENQRDARLYWQQAKSFFDASERLPINSKPLTAYYCCLNAVRALLVVHGKQMKNTTHGISSNKSNLKSDEFSKEKIKIFDNGIFYDFLSFFGEEEIVNKKSSNSNNTFKFINVKDIFYNIACIHRAYSLTYPDDEELFIPIKNVSLENGGISEDEENILKFEVDKRYIAQLPKKYSLEETDDNSKYVPVKQSFSKSIKTYYHALRKEMVYIQGDSTLWYLKSWQDNNNRVLKINDMALIMAGLHWMSELVRYNPTKFNDYRHSEVNWLLNEFIQQGFYQFVDEISCEITGHQILSTGHRGMLS